MSGESGNIRGLIGFVIVIRSTFGLILVSTSIALAGCQSSGQVDGKSSEQSTSPDSILSRDKDANKALKKGETASIKDEFIKSLKKEGGKSNQVSRDDCEAITTKSQFRYSSLADKGILVYPIDNSLVPIHHLASGKCSVLEAIVLDEEASKFTYSSDGEPLTKQVSLWSLEKIEGCGDEFEYVPGCQTLAKYKKVLFVGDQEKAADEVTRNEYSIHHREPSASWLTGNCRLVQGDDKFNCKKFYSLAPLKKYREYVVSGSKESFDVYVSNSGVSLE